MATLDHVADNSWPVDRATVHILCAVSSHQLRSVCRTGAMVGLSNRASPDPLLDQPAVARWRQNELDQIAFPLYPKVRQEYLD